MIGSNLGAGNKTVAIPEAKKEELDDKKIVKFLLGGNEKMKSIGDNLIRNDGSENEVRS